MSIEIGDKVMIVNNDMSDIDIAYFMEAAIYKCPIGYVFKVAFSDTMFRAPKYSVHREKHTQSSPAKTLGYWIPEQWLSVIERTGT